MNVGVQNIPDRVIWKPMVAKRNNTTRDHDQILVTQDSRQLHMAKQPASHDWPEQTICFTNFGSCGIRSHVIRGP